MPPSCSVPRRAARALSALIACALAASACGGVPTKPAGSTLPVASTAAEAAGAALQLDPRVTSGRLANGLSYFLQQHRMKDHRAHVVLMVKAGSVYEQEDERGLAHFIEHMAFNGTQRYPKQTLVDFFERAGLRFGAHANAATSYDRTQYQLIVPTDDPKLLLGALNVLSDWASQISFDAAELESERNVLASEWTSSRGMLQRVGEQQRRLLLAGSQFAQREVIGDKAVLETAPRERLQRFYQSWYRPERMAVIVVGDIDPSAVQAAIQERFGALAAPDAPAVPEPSLDIPVKQGTSAAVITDPEAPGTMLDIVLKARSRPVRTEADFRAQLVNVMATLMLSRRLDEISDNPLAPFTNAGSGLSPSLLGQLDIIEISARAKDGQVQKALDLLLDESERVRRHGFTQAELRRVKEQYLRFLDHAVAAQDTVEVSALTAALANHFVTGNAVTAADFQKKLGLRLLRAIDLAEVKAAVSRWFTSGEQLVLVSGATRDELPQQAAVLAAVDSAKQRTIEPYQDPASGGALMAAAPTPGKVVKEEQIAEIGVTVWTLSNGARVVLKPTDFKRDQILEQSISYGGNAREPASNYPSVRVAHEIVAVSGVGQLDRAQLNRALDGKLVSAYPWIDEQNEGIRASATP
jgi:zinc protease